MKLEVSNPNYCATVIRVKTIAELEGCDNIVGVPMFGLQAITSRDTHVGDLGILFPAEVQLSPEFVSANNMFRHSEQNADTTTKGYLEDNRRVRALKLRGHRSDALFMPLVSLLRMNVGDLEMDKLGKEGTQFDCINGVPICQKYVRIVREPRSQQQKKSKPRVDERLFPQMFDQMQWLRVDRTFHDSTQIVVTQKIHGTSIRIGNVPVARKLGVLERIARRLGVKVADTEFSMVYGSRKVVKDANNPNQQHYYDTDLWTAEGKKLDGIVPENYIIYGELVGWTEGGAPIQTNYTYDCPPGTRRLYVYRVSVVNAQGTIADLSWDAIVDFCESTGLQHVSELLRTTVGEFGADDGKIAKRMLDTDYVKDGYSNAVPLAKASPCDEGVCIRIEGMIPEIYKLKSPLFLQHETKMLDKEVVDIEADDAIETAATWDAGRRDHNCDWSPVG